MGGNKFLYRLAPLRRGLFWALQYEFSLGRVSLFLTSAQPATSRYKYMHVAYVSELMAHSVGGEADTVARPRRAPAAEDQYHPIPTVTASRAPLALVSLNGGPVVAGAIPGHRGGMLRPHVAGRKALEHDLAIAGLRHVACSRRPTHAALMVSSASHQAGAPLQDQLHAVGARRGMLSADAFMQHDRPLCDPRKRSSGW
jgi:hypothetical protein